MPYRARFLPDGILDNAYTLEYYDNVTCAYRDAEANTLNELIEIAQRHCYSDFAARILDPWNECRIYDTVTGRQVTDIRAAIEADRSTPGAERKSMVKIGIARKLGKVTLTVDAKGLHDVLDTLGVPHSGNMYSDRPRANEAVLNRSTGVISTEVLLRREYPATFDLSGVFTEPPNPSMFQRIGDSGYDQVRKVLEHYQPIDINVTISKKI